LKVIAVLSGGIDSICYAVIWQNRENVDTIHPLIFDYGQKALRETMVAETMSTKLEFKKPKTVDIIFMKKLWPGTQLTDDSVEVKNTYSPDVVVPIRNAVFLAIATAYAYSIGAKVVIYGAHMGDIVPNPITGEPLYPDCSPEFQMVLETALNIGHFRHTRQIEIHSPARDQLSKVDIVKKGFDLIGDTIFETWSCYQNYRLQCGVCESCQNRRKTFELAGIEDKTKYLKEVID